MASHLTVNITVRFRWWVWPYLSLAKLNLALGIPVNIDHVAETVARRGLKIEIK